MVIWKGVNMFLLVSRLLISFIWRFLCYQIDKLLNILWTDQTEASQIYSLISVKNSHSWFVKQYTIQGKYITWRKQSPVA